MRHIAGALLLLALLIQVAGCAKSQHSLTMDERELNIDEAHAALVLPPPALIELEDAEPAPHDTFAWEYGRNDRGISYQPWSALRPYGWTETYTRDRFNTHNGRLHDHSRFEIRSYRIR